MKTFIFLFVLVGIATSVQAQTNAYLWQGPSWEALKETLYTQSGLPEADADDALKILTRYQAYIDGQLEPFFQQLTEKADKEGYRLVNMGNIPTLMYMARGIGQEVNDMFQPLVHQKMSREHTDTYARLMHWFGVIYQLDKEMRAVLRQNYEFLQSQGLFSAFLKHIDTNTEILEGVLVQSGRFGKELF